MEEYLKVGEQAPDFESTDQEGNKIKLSDFIRGLDGKYVAVGKASLDAIKIMETRKGPAAEILLRGGQESI